MGEGVGTAVGTGVAGRWVGQGVAVGAGLREMLYWSSQCSVCGPAMPSTAKGVMSYVVFM